MTDKQIKIWKSYGISNSIIKEALQFAADNNSEILYLTLLGSNEYRIMKKDLTSGKVDAKIFSIRE